MNLNRLQLLVKRPVLLILSMVLLAACTSFNASDDRNPGDENSPAGDTGVPFSIVDDLPPAIKTLQEITRGMPGVFAAMDRDDLYIMASAGPYPNTCYALTVEKVSIISGELHVDLNLQEPTDDDVCGEAIVYPQQVVRIDDPSIQAGSPIIHDLPDNPLWNQDGTTLAPWQHDRIRNLEFRADDGELKVTGQARDIFEGHLQYSVFDNGWFIESGVTVIDDTYGRWADFELPIDRGDTVMLYTHSAKDGSLEGVSVVKR